ncbi:MAG: flagellar protein FlgN [Lachnospirales bacterium]
MSGLLSNLINSLTEEKQYYTELALISKEKRKVIIENDLENLSRFTTVENVLISKINKIDVKISNIIKDIGIVLNIKGDDLTITNIANSLNNEEEKSTLLDLSKDLIDAVNALKKHNNTNKELLSTALDYVNFSMNVLQNVNADKAPNSSKALKEAKRRNIQNKEGS